MVENVTNEHQPNLQEETPQDSSLPSEMLYAKIANEGVKYIKSKKRYIILSILFPILIIFCQIANFIIVIVEHINSTETPPRPIPLFDLLATLFIFATVSIFMLIHLFYLLNWNFKVKKYLEQREIIVKDTINSESEEVDPEKFVSLSQIFYDIIDHMRNIRVIFICLNIISLLYLAWIIRRLLLLFLFVVNDDNPFPLSLIILNSITQVGFIVYLGIQWNYYLKWNKKLSKLDAFEKRIYEELDIES